MATHPASSSAPSGPRSGARRRAALGAALGVWSLALATFATHARPVIDEGKFLHAGRLVAEGQLPYRDFPSSQSPLLPYAYALAPELAGSPLLGGRALAGLASLAAMAATLALTARLGGASAVVATLGVALATLPALWVAATVRAQSLATPLVVLGVAALALPRRGALGWSLAPSLLLWACALRLTNGLVFAAVAAWVASQLWRRPARGAAVAAIVAAQALVAFAPFWIAPRHAWFHVFVAQATRAERFGVPDRRWSADLAKRFVDYRDLLFEAWLPALLALALCVGLALWLARGGRPRWRDPLGDARSAQLVLAVAAALALAPHVALSDAFPSYLSASWALLWPAIGLAAATAFGGRLARPWALGAALLALAALNAAQQADIWIGRGDASFASFRAVAREVGAIGGPECTMLTLEAALAVEAGCRLFPGLEYAHFSYDARGPHPAPGEPGLMNLAQLQRRVAADPPELVVVGPGHPQILGGVRDTGALAIESEADARRAWIGFLGDASARYRQGALIRIPSGASRRDWTRDAQPRLVYERVEPPIPPDGS